MAHTFTIRAEWDAASACWVAAADDVPGLVTGADTFEDLIEKLKLLIPELLELNGVLPIEEARRAPFRVIAERHEPARAVA